MPGECRTGVLHVAQRAERAAVSRGAESRDLDIFVRQPIESVLVVESIRALTQKATATARGLPSPE